jgi:radical SAM superfamily enzyme YgiQ (UPF0313 family)
LSHILCIHPWIYDFAAYNLWIEPLGLLTVAAALRRAGHEVALVDCLDRHHPAAPAPRSLRDAYGCGAFAKVDVPKPAALAHIPRRWGRYGLPVEVFETELAAQPRPDAVLVTSMMTYWYPGPFEAIRRVKARWPGVPIALGGVYATLCANHARRYSGADAVLPGPGVRAAVEWVATRFARTTVRAWQAADCRSRSLASSSAGSPSADDPPRAHRHGEEGGEEGGGTGTHPTMTYPVIPSERSESRDLSRRPVSDDMLQHDGLVPAHDLRRPQGYVAVLTARGCPYNCPYCAVHALCAGTFAPRDPASVVDEIAWCVDELGARDVAFYDDALLYNAEEHIHPLLDGILARGIEVRFHTPNGLHARFIDRTLARKMRRAGFVTLRLGLETADPAQQARDGNKVWNEAFASAVDALLDEGFSPGQVAAYVLAGRPGQTVDSVRATVAFAQGLGIAVLLAQFSPIPGTVEWDVAVERGDISPDADPLLHNNSTYPCGGAEVWEAFKVEVRTGNRALRPI